jgi:nicotinamidase-related amidase
MLLDAAKSCLLLVDVQEKLLPVIHEYQQLIDNCRWMLEVANLLNVPILAFEQYPKGLGPTAAALREILPPEAFTSKLHFSCAAEAPCLQKINALQRQQTVLIGIETHVCVLQTAISLKMQNKDVFVVADAVSNRDPKEAKLAFERMRHVGIHIISKEMALFEWARQAGTAEFKKLSETFLR